MAIMPNMVMRSYLELELFSMIIKHCNPFCHNGSKKSIIFMTTKDESFKPDYKFSIIISYYLNFSNRP